MPELKEVFNCYLCNDSYVTTLADWERHGICRVCSRAIEKINESLHTIGPPGPREEKAAADKVCYEQCTSGADSVKQHARKQWRTNRMFWTYQS